MINNKLSTFNVQIQQRNKKKLNISPSDINMWNEDKQMHEANKEDNENLNEDIFSTQVLNYPRRTG